MEERTNFLRIRHMDGDDLGVSAYQNRESGVEYWRVQALAASPRVALMWRTAGGETPPRSQDEKPVSFWGAPSKFLSGERRD